MIKANELHFAQVLGEPGDHVVRVVEDYGLAARDTHRQASRHLADALRFIIENVRSHDVFEFTMNDRPIPPMLENAAGDSGYPRYVMLSAGVVGGTVDAFLTHFAEDGGSLVYSTHFGGQGDDFGNDVAIETMELAHEGVEWKT